MLFRHHQTVSFPAFSRFSGHQTHPERIMFTFHPRDTDGSEKTHKSYFHQECDRLLTDDRIAVHTHHNTYVIFFPFLFLTALWSIRITLEKSVMFSVNLPSSSLLVLGAFPSFPVDKHAIIMNNQEISCIQLPHRRRSNDLREGKVRVRQVQRKHFSVFILLFFFSRWRERMFITPGRILIGCFSVRCGSSPHGQTAQEDDHVSSDRMRMDL